MTDRNDQRKDPASSFPQPDPTRIDLLQLKSVALTLAHDYCPDNAQPEIPAGRHGRKHLASKLLNASVPVKSWWRL